MLSAGLEPATLALLAPCSTDWATRAYIILENQVGYKDNSNTTTIMIIIIIKIKINKSSKI